MMGDRVDHVHLPNAYCRCPMHCTKKCVGGGGRGGVGLGDVCGCYSDESDLVLEIRNSQAPTPESVALSRDIVCLCLSPSHGVGIPLTESGVRSGEDDPGSPRE